MDSKSENIVNRKLLVRDNIHYSFRSIDGYNKPFRLVISAREAGKSTAFWLDKAYKAFIKGQTTLVLRRSTVAITDAYIQSIRRILEQFNEGEFNISYCRGTLKDGIVDVKLNGQDFILIVSLSVSVDRVKSLVYHDIAQGVFDEFICNPAFGEKYQPKEYDVFREIYTTFKRFYIYEEDIKNGIERPMFPFYFMGNPYSLYNPYFLHFNVPLAQCKKGTILTGVNWVVQNYEITQELRDFILKTNPLYQFDDSYTQYALEGQAINDIGIKVIPNLPRHFKLSWVLRIEGQYIGIYSNKYYDGSNDRLYCQFVDKSKINRDVFCFEFDDLVDGTIMKNRNDMYQFIVFKVAMRNRQISFSDINCYNLSQQVYFYL